MLFSPQWQQNLGRVGSLVFTLNDSVRFYRFTYLFFEYELPCIESLEMKSCGCVLGVERVMLEFTPIQERKCGLFY
jgi:hypothetical protein